MLLFKSDFRIQVEVANGNITYYKGDKQFMCISSDKRDGFYKVFSNITEYLLSGIKTDSFSDEYKDYLESVFGTTSDSFFEGSKDLITLCKEIGSLTKNQSGGILRYSTKEFPYSMLVPYSDRYLFRDATLIKDIESRGVNCLKLKYNKMLTESNWHKKFDFLPYIALVEMFPFIMGACSFAVVNPTSGRGLSSTVLNAEEVIVRSSFKLDKANKQETDEKYFRKGSPFKLLNFPNCSVLCYYEVPISICYKHGHYNSLMTVALKPYSYEGHCSIYEELERNLLQRGIFKDLIADKRLGSDTLIKRLYKEGVHHCSTLVTSSLDENYKLFKELNISTVVTTILDSAYCSNPTDLIPYLAIMSYFFGKDSSKPTYIAPLRSVNSGNFNFPYDTYPPVAAYLLSSNKSRDYNAYR